MKPEERPSISPALKDKLLQISTATGCMNLYKMGIRNTYMKGLYPLTPLGIGKRLVGRAVTLRFLPLREDVDALLTPEDRHTAPYRRAVESIVEGDILVVDAMGNLETGTLGDMLSARIKYRGAVATVVDGAVRDSPFIRQVGLPTFVRGVHAGGIERGLMSFDVNTPIQCGGVLVMPNDIILADDEGVIVIPPGYAERLAEAGVNEEDEERFIRAQIEAGMSIQEVYPPNEKWLAEYKAQKNIS
jgi:5-oxopent-3-ene-1,2,5-tricarboxylate decarboxylase/2-hydroxyhepta-2,4-diene-1,7-dioate isomerase